VLKICMCASHAFWGTLVSGASVPDENGTWCCACAILLRSPLAVATVQTAADLRKARRFLSISLTELSWCLSATPVYLAA
jgi:hypothetical protein